MLVKYQAPMGSNITQTFVRPLANIAASLEMVCSKISIMFIFSHHPLHLEHWKLFSFKPKVNSKTCRSRVLKRIITCQNIEFRWAKVKFSVIPYNHFYYNKQVEMFQKIIIPIVNKMEIVSQAWVVVEDDLVLWWNGTSLYLWLQLAYLQYLIQFWIRFLWKFEPLC